MTHQENADFVRQALEQALAQTEQETKGPMGEAIHGLIAAGLTQKQVLAIAQFQSAGMQFNQALIGRVLAATLDHLDETSHK